MKQKILFASLGEGTIENVEKISSLLQQEIQNTDPELKHAT